MTDSQSSRKFRRIIVYTSAFIVFFSGFLALLYGLRPMLLPFILGAFLAYLFKPVAKSFRGSSVSNYLRAGLLLYLVGVGIYWCFNFVKESLPNEKEQLQLKVRLQYRLNERYQNWMGLNDGGKGNFIYAKLGKDLDQLKQKATDYLRLSDDERKIFLQYHKRVADLERVEKGEEIDDHSETLEYVEVSEADKRYYQYFRLNSKLADSEIKKLKTKVKNTEATIKPEENSQEATALQSLMTAFSHWIIMPLAFIFILLDKGQIVHFFMRLVPNRYFELAYSILENVDEALGKYIRGTLVECLLVGISLTIGFYLCGFEIKIAVLIGLIGGLTNAIPFVGTLLACVIGAIYSLIAENVQPILPFVNENNLVVAVIAVVMVAHLLDNAIFQPLVVGSAVNIHPLVVVLGVFGGSLMFGFAGLIFAIPTIVIIKVVTETFFTGLKDYRII